MLIAMASLLLIACKKEASPEHIERNSLIGSVEFQHISYGHILSTPFKNDPNSRVVVINDNSQWKQFLQEVNRPDLLNEKIDFNTEQMVIAFDKMEVDGRSHLDIVSIVGNENNTVVTVQIQGLNTVIDTPTQVFHIVKMLKVGKSFVIKQK